VGLADGPGPALATQRVADAAQQQPPARVPEPLPCPEQTPSSPAFPKLLLTSHKLITSARCLLNTSIYFCFLKGENLN